MAGRLEQEMEMKIALPPLPYAYNALEPFISTATLKLHHGAHHRGYVDKLNTLIGGSDLEGAALEEIIRRSAPEAAGAPRERAAIFNNAAQAWNHAFFWRSLHPVAQRPARHSPLAAHHAAALKAAATGLFGSGWAWLVEDAGMVKVVATANADTPILRGQRPLLVLDVWEHAYYLDHQNRRDRYVEAVVEHLLDWEFAERNLLGEAAAHAG
jgi:superoxide dismutase, Fe-Mn family